MTKVTFRSATADDIVLDVEPGVSVMQAAVQASIEGIVADCGGQCQCATCHVYVDDACAEMLPPMSEDEDDMLEVAACERTNCSRLSCQLVMDKHIIELTVDLPKFQR